VRPRAPGLSSSWKEIEMFGIGIAELMRLLVVLLTGLAMVGGLFAVIYFAVRAGTRRNNEQSKFPET
jgi:hypothetical protein